MTAFAQTVGGLAASCALFGVVFMWAFKVRHWVHGHEPAIYSRLLGNLSQVIFTIAPVVVWAGNFEESKKWTGVEALTAAVLVFLVLRMYDRAAYQALQARLARQRARK